MSNIQQNTPSYLDEVVSFPITIKFMLNSTEYSSSETRFLNEVVFLYHGEKRTVRFFGLKQTDNLKHLLLGFDLDKEDIRSFYFEEMKDIKYNIVSKDNIPAFLFVHDDWLHLLLEAFEEHKKEQENVLKNNSEIIDDNSEFEKECEAETSSNQIRKQSHVISQEFKGINSSILEEENECNFNLNDMKCLNASSAKKISDDFNQKMRNEKTQVQKILVEINDKILEKAKSGENEVYFNCYGFDRDLILKVNLCLVKLGYEIFITCVNEDVKHYQIRIKW